MKREKVVSAIRKARADFKLTPAGKLSCLLAARAKWSRRVTVAQNKLDLVNREVSYLAYDLIHGKDKNAN